MAEIGYVGTNGARLYYEVDGEGPDVLAIHAGIANLRMWDDQVDALAPHYRVIRYDTRGFGHTETDAVEFSNRADAAAVLDHVGAESAVVIGASRGGIIGLDFTLEFPDRVEALVVAAGGVGGYMPEGIDDDEAMWEDVEAHWEAKDWAWLTDFDTTFWVDGPGQPPDRVDPAIRRTVEGWIRDNYLAEKEEGKPVVLDPPAAGRLGEVGVPVLVMVGDLDEPATVASCRYLADQVPDARFELFEGAAHMLNMEQPDRFNETLLGFLESVG
jgi:3-oxoadipate enol-lactonase